MNSAGSDDASRESQLDLLLAEYLRRFDSGEAIDRGDFLGEHGEFSDELQELLETADLIDDMAGPLLIEEDAQATQNGPAPEARPDALPDTIKLTAPSATDSATPPSPPSPTPPPCSEGEGVLRRVGGYELLEEIGRGGMGVVYKARQIRLNRIVAVKMILSGRLASEADVKRFYGEAQAAGKLRHPSIVSIHQVIEAGGNHLYSMDYIAGDTLAETLREGPLPAERAARYLKSIAEAVQYAHAKGIYHRDLKPANVLIDADDRPQITDFGLAKQAEGGAGLTLPGAAVGTPSYMPPEYASGKRVEITPAGDIYSLGAVLYEMLTGRPPFRADTPLDTMYQVIHRPPRLPRLINPEVDRDLETICMKCLQKDPRRRYRSADEVVEELGRYLQGEPIRAKPIGRLGRAYYWIRGVPLVAALSGRGFPDATPWHRRTQTMILAVPPLLLLLAVLAWMLWPETLPREIRIAAGHPGGMYHPLSEDLAKVLTKRTGRPSSVLETKGSVDNRRRLIRGRAELALLQSSAFSAEEIRIVTVLYYETVYVVARNGRGIASVEDLDGKAVSLGPEGSGMRLSAVKVLEFHGVDPGRLTRSNVYFTELLTDRRMDAAIITVGSENSAGLKALLSRPDFALLGIPNAVELAEKHECFKTTQVNRGEVPAGLELPEQGIPTVMTPAFLAVRTKAGDRFVREVLEALYSDDGVVARYGLLPPDRAADWQGWALHPAAREFFRSGMGDSGDHTPNRIH